MHAGLWQRVPQSARLVDVALGEQGLKEAPGVADAILRNYGAVGHKAVACGRRMHASQQPAGRA